MSKPGMKVPRRKLVTSAIVLLTILVSWSGYIERKTEAYIDSATVQAGIAFVTARTLNRVITSATSVEVEISAGFGSISGKPFELLDPLHDVVERYSVVMEIAIVSLVTQKVLIELTSALSFKLLVTLIGLLLIASVFIKEGRFSNWLFHVFIFFALVRFLFVFSIAGSGILDQAYVNKETEKNLSHVRVTAAEFEQLQPAFELDAEEEKVLKGRLEEIEGQAGGLVTQVRAAESAIRQADEDVRAAEAKVKSIEDALDFVKRNDPFTKNQALIGAREELSEARDRLTAEKKRLEASTAALDSGEKEAKKIREILEGRRSTDWLDNFAARAKSMLDISRFDGLYERVTEIISNILNLIALFLLKTLLMPLIFLLLLLRGFRYIWGMDFRDLGRSVVAEVRGKNAKEDNELA